MLESRGWGEGRDGKAEADNCHWIDPHVYIFDYHITNDNDTGKLD